MGSIPLRATRKSAQAKGKTMELSEIVNAITCPVCQSARVWNQRGTDRGSLFECENDHQWNIADGKRYVLGGAINIGEGRWRFWTEGRDAPVDMQIFGPIMIEALRLNLVKHYGTECVKIVAGQRMY